MLAIDTATRRAAVAIGSGRDAPVALRSWEAGYRHGEELLSVLDEVLREAGTTLTSLSAVVVGTGPGAFTGLRVGLATAKGLAYGLRIPLIGVRSTAALALAAWLAGGARLRYPETVVVMPAGPHDRYLARYRVAPGGWDASSAPGLAAVPVEEPELVPGGESIVSKIATATLVVVDLPAGPEIAADACELGLAAQAGLGAALLAAGREALDLGRTDDVAALVPAYVTLPRGIAARAEMIEWSRDHR